MSVIGTTALSALAIFSLATAGCSLALPDVTFVNNACADDSDCHDATCDMEIGMCVGSPDTTLQVGLEILPAWDPMAERPAIVSLDPVAVDGPKRHDISLPPAITVAGTVRWSGLDGTVTADVVFVRPTAFPGSREARTIVSTSIADVSVEGYGGDYAARVTANTHYDVTVRPTGDASLLLPPMSLSVDVPGGGDLWQFNMAFPDELIEIIGVVVDSAGDPVDGLQVQALSRNTLEVISSMGTTGSASVPGGFSVRLLPDETRDYVLRITGAVDGEAIRATTLFDPAYSFPGEELVILVPSEVDSIHYQGTVEGTEGDPLEGAALSFRSANVIDATTNVIGQFETTAISDASGIFDATLLPGTYDVLITPPAGSGASVSLLEAVQIERPSSGNTLQGQLYVLPPQVTLSGRLQTSDGRSVQGATLEAVALGEGSTTPGQQVAAYNRSTDAVTDHHGRFVLAVDVGSYDLIVKPPSGSGFAWLVAPNLDVPAGSEELTEELSLGAPVPFSGVLRDVNGAAVAGAEISAFGILQSAEGTARAAPLGRTVTAEDGSYMLLLPPSL